MIDRLERYLRITGGVPAEFGGESTQNVRTGRRGDAILSAIIDFPIADAQSALAASLAVENRIGIENAKAWFGDRLVGYHYAEGKRLRSGSYRASEVFDESSYPKRSEEHT